MQSDKTIIKHFYTEANFWGEVNPPIPTIRKNEQ